MVKMTKVYKKEYKKQTYDYALAKITFALL